MDGKWTDEGKRQIFEAVAVLVEMQKAYGKEINLKTLLRGWQALLEDKFTPEQVCYAVKEYMLKHDDLPTPANIIQILNPEKPKITESQFIAAQKWQERNGYPQYSDAAYTIRDYNRQNDEKVDDYKIECDKIAGMIGNSIKRIGGNS